jgi:predicted cupin superfamily sugar epimerase
MDQQIRELVDRLQLKPHPEGGFYREIYRSEGVIGNRELGPAFEGSRNYATGIYFLLTAGNFSAFHRIRQDEVWHFYKGAPLDLHIISPGGERLSHVVGNEIMAGQHPQVTVPAGCWFASGVRGAGSYSLVGCTVSPGFDFRDFELAKRNELVKLYPQHSELILSFTREI